MSEDANKFDESKLEHAAKVGRSIVGAIPFAGPALNEIITQIIPNQRIDRVTDYLSKLHDVIPEERMAEFKDMPEKLALIEEGMLSAGFVTNKEKQKRISEAVAYGLSDDDLNRESFDHILRLLQSLSTTEAIILESYKYKPEERISFERLYLNVFPEFPPGPLSDNYDKLSEGEYHKEYERCSNQKDKNKSYEQHLASMGLLRPIGEDYNDGKITYEATALGKELLASIHEAKA